MFPIRAPGNTVDGALVSLDDALRPATLGVPNADGPVIGPGEYALPVRAEGHTQHPVTVSFQHTQFSPSLQVPNSGSSVIASGDGAPSVCAQSDAVHPTKMPLQHAWRSFAFDITAQYLALAAGDGSLPVRTISNRNHICAWKRK
ncbi:MAG TPA: hypothetical protein VFP59_20120 [Candidatus Angelobacter sp.]|nr:hypothetical protein [Candidatus Angelobacter sp.]